MAGLKPAASSTRNWRAINCATPRFGENMRFSVSGQTCGQTENLRTFKTSGEPKKSVFSRGLGICRFSQGEISDYVPNVALYQAEPHLDNVFENDCNMCFMSFQFARAPRGRERCRRMVALFSQRSSLQHSLLWAGQSLKTVCQTVFNSFTTKLSHTSMFLCYFYRKEDYIMQKKNCQGVGGETSRR